MIGILSYYRNNLIKTKAQSWKILYFQKFNRFKDESLMAENYKIKNFAIYSAKNFIKIQRIFKKRAILSHF